MMLKIQVTYIHIASCYTYYNYHYYYDYFTREKKNCFFVKLKYSSLIYKWRRHNVFITYYTTPKKKLENNKHSFKKKLKLQPAWDIWNNGSPLQLLKLSKLKKFSFWWKQRSFLRGLYSLAYLNFTASFWKKKKC